MYYVLFSSSGKGSFSFPPSVKFFSSRHYAVKYIDTQVSALISQATDCDYFTEHQIFGDVQLLNVYRHDQKHKRTLLNTRYRFEIGIPFPQM